MSPARWLAAIVALAFLPLSGCAEWVEIKSYPPGAKAYVDGSFIGTTPASTEIPRNLVTPNHTWKVEFRNCEPAEGRIERGVAGGRIAGYIFTAGILAIFRGPYYFAPVDVALNGGDCEPPNRARPAAAAPPAITVQQIVGDRNVAPASGGPQMTDTERLAERLTTLRDLYNRTKAHLGRGL
jgi:PEGA domain